jgi:hypothetical protein
VHIPTSLLLTADCIPAEFRNKHNKISIHGLLASFLTYEASNGSEQYQLWMATWPTMDDLEDVLPTFLDDSHRKPLNAQIKGTSKQFLILPPAIGGTSVSVEGVFNSSHLASSILAKQELKIKNDLEAAQQAFPDIDAVKYKYFWLMVNTRSFYYDMPMAFKPQSKDDKMILCPFVDYFNHEDHGVSCSSR